jgi:hypothetical protein
MDASQWRPAGHAASSVLMRGGNMHQCIGDINMAQGKRKGGVMGGKVISRIPFIAERNIAGKTCFLGRREARGVHGQ